MSDQRRLGTEKCAGVRDGILCVRTRDETSRENGATAIVIRRRRADCRKACRVDFCAGSMAVAAVRFDARFSIACASARLTSSFASSAASLRTIAARAPASSVSSEARCAANRVTTAEIAEAWRAPNAASIPASAFRRAARWLAMRRSISARSSARRDAVGDLWDRKCFLSSAAFRVSGASWLGLSR